MKTVATSVQNALLRKNGEFIVKDQIIFQYPKAITTQQVKAQINYLIGKRTQKAAVEVKELDKNKHIFLIAAQGAHLWSAENVAHGFVKLKPVPPPPPPVYPIDIYRNTLIIQQKGLKNKVSFKSDMFKIMK